MLFKSIRIENIFLDTDADSDFEDTELLMAKPAQFSHIFDQLFPLVRKTDLPREHFFFGHGKLMHLIAVLNLIFFFFFFS